MRFQKECVSDEQDSDSVTAAQMDQETGVNWTARAAYLFAADGAGSPIRTEFNILTTGQGTRDHLLNILFDANPKTLVH